MVDHGEGAHPEVVPHPRHEPVLGPSGDSGVVDERRPRDGHEGKDGSEADDDARLLRLGVLVEVKVPDCPVPDGGKALEGGAEDKLVEGGLPARPLLVLLGHHRVPGGVLHQPGAREKQQQTAR